MTYSLDSPKRIQRKRTKGWKMPPNTVYVGRPSRFGNPFWHLAKFGSVEDSLIAYRMAVDGIWDPSRLKHVSDGALHVACQDFAEFTKTFKLANVREDIRSNLRGRDLACWCPLDQPCHADILLEIANS